MITETWLQERIAFKVRGAKTAQSPRLHNQGVLIVAQQPTANLQPVFEPLWTTNTIVVLCHMALSPQQHLPLYVICHYSQPGRKRELDEELKYYVARIREETHS